MRKLALVLVFVLLATPAFAERWIKCIDTTIGTVTFENPRRVEGDCLALGLCSGANNTGLATNVFEAEGSEWSDASQANKKCDRVAVVGSRIVNLTAQEISDINDALTSQIDSALRAGAKGRYDGQTEDGQVLRCMAKAIIDELNTLRTRDRDRAVDVANSANLSALKSNWAAEPTLNDRTLAQAKTNIQNCIDNGDADE